MKTKLLGSAALAVLLSTGAAFAQATDFDRSSSGMKNDAASQPHGTAPSNPTLSDTQSQRSSSEGRSSAKPNEAVRDELPSQSNQKPDMKAEGTKQQKTMDKQAADKKIDDDRATSSKTASDKMEPSAKSADTNKSDHADRKNDRADQQMKKSEQNAQRSDPGMEKTGRSAANDVKLDSNQQTKVRDAFRNERADNITKVDFNIRVGGVVPDHHHFYPLPATVVDIVPQYRGYDYIVANDEIVIVEPGTHHIVYTMQQGRSAARDARPVECR